MNEIFDTEKQNDLLTIRYFHLTGDIEGVMGDSIYIQTPEGHSMLIDAGTPDAGPQVVRYLNLLGVQSIDVVINTHPHIDHIGGFSSVLPEIEVKKLYMEDLPYPASEAYMNAMNALENERVPYEILQEGSVFWLGEDVSIEVLNPEKEVLPDAVKTFKASEINQFSIVFKMKYKNQSFLFPADIYIDREEELVDRKKQQLKADFLHAPHHGWNTSSSPKFIAAVSPQVVVFSNDKVGHLEVKERYEEIGAEVYSTGIHGNILITSDGSKLKVITEKSG